MHILDSNHHAGIDPAEAAEIAQNYQDDIDTWGHLPAAVSVEGTDFELSPEDFKIALAALRDHYAQHATATDALEA